MAGQGNHGGDGAGGEICCEERATTNVLVYYSIPKSDNDAVMERVDPYIECRISITQSCSLSGGIFLAD